MENIESIKKELENTKLERDQMHFEANKYAEEIFRLKEQIKSLENENEAIRKVSARRLNDIEALKLQIQTHNNP